jgi:hypothetical protein
VAAAKSITDHPRAWGRILTRVRDQQMPPQGVPGPDAQLRERFTDWVDDALRTAACVDGVAPGPAIVRRLNRSEYAATIRDLLDVHFNAAHSLPSDGAGGEGFDNAAETLSLSPLHAEKYMDAAREALGHAAREPKFRKKFLIFEAATPPDDAAHRNLETFLPRAFRRPVAAPEQARYVALYRSARARGESPEAALLFTYRAALVSPHFLFRLGEVNALPAPHMVPSYEMASRLSYFLWGSMPDATLSELASKDRLLQGDVLDEQVARMLKDVKARDFSESFVEQWLGTRELGRDIKPDPALFAAYYDSELQSAIRYEPVLFFQEIFSSDRSLLEFLDSSFTILTNKLQRHYGLQLPKEVKIGQQPLKIDLPPDSHRGGLTGMAAVLAVSSYPSRTSPVLRGKWVLDAVLGTPPPPPPPNVPQLPEKAGATPATLRERLEEHRRNPVCANCHSRIDPIGFALENYDPLGRYRTEESGKAIDNGGELPGGIRFHGAVELKRVLLERKGLFIRNLTARMLGYALGRGLTLEDRCEVERIALVLERSDYRAQTLVREIVRSVPFRYQAGTAAGRSVPGTEVSKR